LASRCGSGGTNAGVLWVAVGSAVTAAVGHVERCSACEMNMTTL